MSDWATMNVTLDDPTDESPNPRKIELLLNVQRGYPAYTRGAPEDCYPGEADQWEILDGWYVDASATSRTGPLPKTVTDALSEEHADVIEELIQSNGD